MEENVTLENQAGDETIEETGTQAAEPDIKDNSIAQPVDESTSSNVKNDNADENFLGTFKTKEDADKGFKEAQAKITSQGNRIKELEKQLNINSSSCLPDVNSEVEAVKQKVNEGYSQHLKGLGYKYSSFLPNDVVINTIDDIVENLPPLQASQFTAELINIQNSCNAQLQNEINGIYKNANSKFEELKANDKERYKDNEIVFNAWYNPPETIEQVAELVENVKKKAIEDYIKDQAAKQEDDEHKGKLHTNTSSQKLSFADNHVFTRQEIDKMSVKEFQKFEKQIDAQIAKGLIK